MRIDDAALISYLIKHLQPLTEADPNLLANYVVALLKNNKPKKDLEALCINQLLDFLGDESKAFVANLFNALEDGTITVFQEEQSITKTGADTSATVQSSTTSSAREIMEQRTSQSEKLVNPTMGMHKDHEDHEEDGSDDEDDDRNHKHRRRVSRSPSLGRDPHNGPVRKRTRSSSNGQPIYDNSQTISEITRGTSDIYVEKEGPPKRRPSRENAQGNSVRPGGIISRPGSAFRGDGSVMRFEYQNGLSRGVLGRGRGANPVTWGRDQRNTSVDVSDFNLSMIPSGPSIGMYAGRPTSIRGLSSWAGYSQFGGVANGVLDQSLPLNTGIQGSRGVSVSASLGVGMNIGMGMPLGRPRCADFEERGYCLRGDLCPLDHGANRIVVEDVQSLSKFNLPVTLPTGRNIVMGPASKSTATFSPYPANLGLSSVRETSMPSIEEANLSKGGGVVGIAEPDLYDPDQPLWNKEQPTDDRIKKPPLSRKGTGDDEMENMGRNADEGTSTGSQGLPSVWNRIGHVDRSDTNSESILRPNPSVYRSRVSRREFLEARETTIATGKSNLSDERDEKTTLMTDVNTVPEGQQRPSEKIGFNPRGKWNKEQGSERAQRTLYIGGIPSNVNKKELLKAHFQKFGEIMDIRIPSSQGDRAFVQFLLPENAESALKSPEAVMGNRFIRLSWAKRDSIPIPLVEEGNGISTSATWNLKGVPLESVMKGKKQLGISISTPEENTLKGISKVAISNPQPSPPNPQSTPSSISQKKQEELEHMKEELRKKQEDLAQKRDEFRRKLERLSKQGTGEVEKIQLTKIANSVMIEEITGNQPTNKSVKVEASQNDSIKQVSSSLPSGDKSLMLHDQPTKDLSKAHSASAQTSFGSITQPSPKSLRVHSPWAGTGSSFPGSSPWGPLRYKLDNRTTIFRVIPPFPDNSLDVPSLKEHFSHFGEVINVESEDTVDKNSKGFRVTFSTRSGAELAFAQGKWYQGITLQFNWVNPSPTVANASASNVHIESPAPENPGNGSIQNEPEDSKPSKIDDDSGSLIQNELIKNPRNAVELGDREIPEGGHRSCRDLNSKHDGVAADASDLCKDETSM